MAAPRRLIIVTIVLSFLFINIIEVMCSNQASYLAPAQAPAPIPQTLDCAVECGRRCSKTKRPNQCKRSCGSCCNKCNCVPPGTSGNHEACSCYANLTNRYKMRKCP